MQIPADPEIQHRCCLWNRVKEAAPCDSQWQKTNPCVPFVTGSYCRRSIGHQPFQQENTIQHRSVELNHHLVRGLCLQREREKPSDTGDMGYWALGAYSGFAALCSEWNMYKCWLQMLETVQVKISNLMLGVHKTATESWNLLRKNKEQAGTALPAGDGVIRFPLSLGS